MSDDILPSIAGYALQGLFPQKKSIKFQNQGRGEGSEKQV